MDVTSKVIIGLDPSEFRRNIQQVDAKLKETSRLFGNLGQAIGAAFAVSQIQAFATEAIALGSQMQTVSKGFARFGNEMNLAELRKSTRGLVSDLDLMKVTVQAGNFGIPIEQMGKLLEFASRRAAETGQSVDYLVESIVTGIGRKSPLILDNLGISTTRLKEKFHGAAIEAQSIADVAKAVGDIAGEELGKMGEAVDTAADKMKRLSTAWQNFKTSVGEAIAPAASGFLELITNTLDQLANPKGSLNKLEIALGTNKPSALVQPQAKAGGASSVAQQAQAAVVTLESLRQKLKDLQTEYDATQVGSKRFYELRSAIEKANYQIGRASGEIWPGAKQSLIDIDAKGLAPLTNGFVYQNMVLRSSVIPAYDAMGRMIAGAKDQMELASAQMAMLNAIGAEFGYIFTSSFNAAMVNSTNFFEELGQALKNYITQMAVAVGVTAALAAVLSTFMPNLSFAKAFKGLAGGTGLGSIFGEGGIIELVGNVNGLNLQLVNKRANDFLRATN